MSKGRLLRRLCFPVALAAVAGGCAGMLNSPATGFVDLEPSKPVDSKSAKLKSISHYLAPAGDDSVMTPREGVASIAGAADRDHGLFVADLPAAGSGFPPLLPRQSGSNDADLGALSAELQATSALSAGEKQALLDDLRQSEPALWPKLVHQFRLALAYRSRGEGQGARGEGSDEGSASVAVDSASMVKPRIADANGTPNTTAADAERTLAKPTEKSETNTVESDKAAPTEPALRPPRKNAEAKRDATITGGKPSDVGKASKPSAATGELAHRSSAGESQLQLTKAILAIEGEASHPQSSSPNSELARQMQLRVLYLAAGRRDDALRPIEGLSAAQQEFWTKEIYGLATYLDHEPSAGSDHPVDVERRAAEAALHLRDAAERLAELAAPAVRNLAFCKEVTSFGVFKKFPKYEFKPGDEALLYCEIENLKSESTDKGYRTSVKARYEILDSRGERVAEQEFPASDDYCARPRRDFFIPYFVSVPKRIGEGSYTLKLTVEDTQTQKTGQGSLQFSVK